MRKKSNKPAKAPEERSRKGTADLEAKSRIRGEAQKAKLRTRQHDIDRPDRGGPQGKKDKDFQRKF
jgi:hypothetical protein